MRKVHYKNYIAFVDLHRRPFRRRSTRGRYRVGAKNPKQARAMVQAAIGFGSVVILKKEDQQMLAKYGEVLREDYEVDENGKTCIKLSRAWHATEPREKIGGSYGKK